MQKYPGSNVINMKVGWDNFYIKHQINYSGLYEGFHTDQQFTKEKLEIFFLVLLLYNWHVMCWFDTFMYWKWLLP